MLWRNYCALKISNNLSHWKEKWDSHAEEAHSFKLSNELDKCAGEGQTARNQNTALLKSPKPVVKCSSLFWVQLIGGNRIAYHREFFLYAKICFKNLLCKRCGCKVLHIFWWEKYNRWRNKGEGVMFELFIGKNFVISSRLE